MLGNDDVARCDFVWRQPGLKRNLPSRLPDDADNSASLRSDVVQLVTESRWLIADRIDSVLLTSDNDPPAGSLMQCGAFLRHPAALAQWPRVRRLRAYGQSQTRRETACIRVNTSTCSISIRRIILTSSVV